MSKTLNNIIDRELLTAKEVAHILKIDERTVVRRLVATEKLHLVFIDDEQCDPLYDIEEVRQLKRSSRIPLKKEILDKLKRGIPITQALKEAV
jgi:hypothetical protein